MSNKHIIDDLAAYALGVLGPPEKEQVEIHLNHCIACQAELRAYQQVIAELPLAAPLQQPPRALKQRLTERINNAGQLSKDRSARRKVRLADFFRLQPAWGFASLALILILIVSNIYFWQLWQQSRSVGEFYMVALAGTDYSPEASGVLVISPDGDEGTLVVEHVPSLDEAYQYQLWLIKDGKRTSGGVFSVSADGYGHLEVTATQSLLRYDGFGITIEPAGGSAGPTGQKVLGGEF